MNFLLSHWHCILPIGIIIIFLIPGIFKKPKNQNTVSVQNGNDSLKSVAVLDKKLANGEITESEYMRKKSLIEQ